MASTKFKPGQARPANAGRKKGTPNKKTQELHEIAERLGVQPFEVLLLFAKGDWQTLGYREEVMSRPTQYGEVWEYTVTPEVRKSAAADACQYLFPKRKAVEHSANEDALDSLADALTRAQERLIKAKA